MFSQFEDMLLTPLVKKMNEHGVNVDAETVKRAVANSPQVVAQIEAALLAGTSEEKMQKILAIITQAAQGGGTSQTSGGTNQTSGGTNETSK
jgi:hypothetical protein